MGLNFHPCGVSLHIHFPFTSESVRAALNQQWPKGITQSSQEYCSRAEPFMHELLFIAKFIYTGCLWGAFRALCLWCENVIWNCCIICFILIIAILFTHGASVGMDIGIMMALSPVTWQPLCVIASVIRDNGLLLQSKREKKKKTCLASSWCMKCKVLLWKQLLGGDICGLHY